MRRLSLLAILVPLALAGCQSGGEQLGDLGASFEGSLGRDTQGTNRRMDVYGGVTSPTMPTISARGYGK
jgi:hypothetical protein